MRKVPAVTEILGLLQKNYLDAWKRRVGEKEASHARSTAAAFGTRLHAAAQDVAVGGQIVVMDDLEPHLEAVRKFLDTHVDEVLEVEKSLASVKLGFGGTFDLYCKLNDGSYGVVDYKTTRQLTRQHGYQLAAYALLAREEGLRVHKRVAVRIKKEKPGEFHARSYTDNRGDVRAFVACRDLWWALNLRKKDGLPDWSPEAA